MNSLNRFELFVILCLISALGVIDSTSNELSRVSNLCYEESERLVRTPYGYRCVVTRVHEKRSPTSPEFSTPGLTSETKDEAQVQKPMLMEEEFLIQNLEEFKSKAKAEPKYRKVVIKNNRGPWKIANVLLKRSSQVESKDAADYKTLGANRNEKNIKQITKSQFKDGFLVNTQVVNDTKTALKKDSYGQKIIETTVPLNLDTSIEQKFIKNLPKINLSAKTVDKKGLRNIKISSDIDVIDLMEEDSMPSLKQHFDDKLSSASDVRRARSPVHGSDETADNKGDDNVPPIKIFVFLNRNRNRVTEHWRTDSSNNWYNIAKPKPRSTYTVIRDSSPATTTSTTTSTTSTTTTTTTTPPPTTASMYSPIKRILKKFDLDEFEGRVASEVLKEMEEKEEEEEDRYTEPTPDITTEDTFTLTPFPISRNWTFVCGKRKGFFADVDNDCRTYYQCSVRGRQRWECPPGTRFNQFSSTCDWMENVNCVAFKDLVNDKLVVDQHIDRTSTTTAIPLVAQPDITPSTKTTIYEPEYEDSWE